MVEKPAAPIPETLILEIDEDRILSGDLTELAGVLKDLVKALKAMYLDIADAINMAPEYQLDSSQPLPAEGRFLAWEKDSPDAGEPAVKLLYNNDGTVEELNRSATTEQQGMVELATVAECQAGTDETRAVTPQGLAAAGGLPSGTKLAFFQASAPTGWTQDTGINDKVLRVVDGEGGGSGGDWTMAALVTAGHGLTEAENGPHTHDYTRYSVIGGHQGTVAINYWRDTSTQQTGSSGSGTPHSHGMDNSGNWRPAYVDVIICEKD